MRARIGSIIYNERSPGGYFRVIGFAYQGYQRPNETLAPNSTVLKLVMHKDGRKAGRNTKHRTVYGFIRQEQEVTPEWIRIRRERSIESWDNLQEMIYEQID